MDQRILNEIINYQKKNMVMPSIRYLQKKFGFKSHNSIVYYLKKLEKEKYLIRNYNKQLTVNLKIPNPSQYQFIKIINDKYKTFVGLYDSNKYLAYKQLNNDLNIFSIYKNDILIINTHKKIKNNELGLFIINNQYKIMKYFSKDGYFILKSTQIIITEKINLIGKVIMIERKIKET